MQVEINCCKAINYAFTWRRIIVYPNVAWRERGNTRIIIYPVLWTSMPGKFVLGKALCWFHPSCTSLNFPQVVTYTLACVYARMCASNWLRFCVPKRRISFGSYWLDKLATNFRIRHMNPDVGYPRGKKCTVNFPLRELHANRFSAPFPSFFYLPKESTGYNSFGLALFAR